MQKSLHTEQHRVLCELLRELRTDAKLSQVQLAEAIDEPQSMVSRVEVGERRLDILELRQWLTALDMSLTVFVRRLESRLSTADAS